MAQFGTADEDGSARKSCLAGFLDVFVHQLARRFRPFALWAEKYKSHGLVVVGVHTPEFDFERDMNNVRQAVKAMKIGYPVALNSEYAIWRAFDNQYWPAAYR